MPTTHMLEPNRDTLRGSYSREHPPILTIQPGDTVQYRTLDAGWGLEPLRDLDHRLTRRTFEPRPPGAGHALVGPVAIAGAQAGMTLAVHVDAVVPGAYGYTFAGGWSHAINDRFGLSDQRGVLHRWTLDTEKMVGRNQHGHTVRLRPFMGILGLAPAEAGIHSTIPPYPTGGNIDCKELIAGTTLFLPVAVEGGWFYTGDGHAAQGDGEASVNGIECPMDHVALRFDVLDDLPLTFPRARTATSWLAFGFHADLQEATYLALDNMLDLMKREYGIADRRDALALASVVVDLRVTQIANKVVGVHAVLADGAIS